MKPGAGAPYRCRPSDHTCVRLESEECPLSYGSSGDPNAIFFGAFATLNPADPETNSTIWAHRLALEELSGDSMDGLPGPGATRRPLVMIVCNNDASVVETALAHLADTLEVPAVLATLKPSDLRRGFEAHADRDIFYLSPVVSTRTLNGLNDNGRIWHMLGEPADMAPTYVSLLGLAEKYEKARRDVTTLRVALVTTTDAYDRDLSNALSLVLKFNGKDLTTNEADGNYAGFTVDTTDPQLLDIATSIVTYRPHIVISAASESFTQTSGIFEHIESEWDGEIPNSENVGRPFYVLSPFNAGDLTGIKSKINAFIRGATGPTPNRRFVGVSVAGAADLTLQNQYATRLRTRFGKDAYTDSGNYYDATYFLTYAIYGAGTAEPLTGSGIARGMNRLLEGQRFDVGPDLILDVQQALDKDDDTIELQGTLGPRPFDPKTGGRLDEGSVLCFSAEDSQVTLKSDVLRYDRGSNELVGDFPCFPGFYP